MKVDKLSVSFVDRCPHATGAISSVRSLDGSTPRSSSSPDDTRHLPRGRDLVGRIHAAVVEQGWRSEIGPIARHELAWTVSDMLRATDAIGLLSPARDAGGRGLRGYELTEPRRVGLVAGLRARAFAPA